LRAVAELYTHRFTRHSVTARLSPSNPRSSKVILLLIQRGSSVFKINSTQKLKEVTRPGASKMIKPASRITTILLNAHLIGDTLVQGAMRDRDELLESFQGEWTSNAQYSPDRTSLATFRNTSSYWPQKRRARFSVSQSDDFYTDLAATEDDDDAGCECWVRDLNTPSRIKAALLQREAQTSQMVKSKSTNHQILPGSRHRLFNRPRTPSGTLGPRRAIPPLESAT